MQSSWHIFKAACLIWDECNFIVESCLSFSLLAGTVADAQHWPTVIFYFLNITSIHFRELLSVMEAKNYFNIWIVNHIYNPQYIGAVEGQNTYLYLRVILVWMVNNKNKLYCLCIIKDLKSFLTFNKFHLGNYKLNQC